jgi:polyisoprenoid-binding protein YceI
MRFFLTLLLAWGLLAVPTVADPVTPPADSGAYQFNNERSSMTVYGSSNVRDWTMDVEQIDGSVVLGNEQTNLPSIDEIQVEVAVNNMVSDKDRLQRHAHDALEKEDYPTIRFASSDVQVATAQADSFSVVAKGDLTIKGNTHTVELTAKGAQQSDGTLHVKGEHGLKLSTFDVERPSLMFGAIKVDDPIRIGFDVVLTPRSP